MPGEGDKAIAVAPGWAAHRALPAGDEQLRAAVGVVAHEDLSLPQFGVLLTRQPHKGDALARSAPLRLRKVDLAVGHLHQIARRRLQHPNLRVAIMHPARAVQLVAQAADHPDRRCRDAGARSLIFGVAHRRPAHAHNLRAVGAPIQAAHPRAGQGEATDLVGCVDRIEHAERVDAVFTPGKGQFRSVPAPRRRGRLTPARCHLARHRLV